jgi:class 3 adenylate cyclase
MRSVSQKQKRGAVPTHRGRPPHRPVRSRKTRPARDIEFFYCIKKEGTHFLFDRVKELRIVRHVSERRHLVQHDPGGTRPHVGHRQARRRADTSGAPSASTGAKPQDAAERRQLTVMFCDLVGSTALSVRFDPEELREEIRAYQNAVSGVVARYDGFVAKFMGDGVLAYFGYPRAHEDDAERAVRAGLEIAAAVTRLETRGTERLAVRIGIATGLVV